MERAVGIARVSTDHANTLNTVRGRHVSEVRDTLRLASALSGKDTADIASDLVKTHLAEPLKQIRERQAGAKKPPKKSDT
jgi:hypothetical protein